MTATLPPADPPSEPQDAPSAAPPEPRRRGSRDSANLWQQAFRRMRRNPIAIVGAAIVLVFVLVALLAPWLAPYPAQATPGRDLIRPTLIPGPSAEFPLGLDRYGSDVLSQLIWGARASLVIGVVSTLLGLFGGVAVGLLAGAFSGWVDTLAMRFVDIMLAIPSLLLAVSIAAIAGQSNSSIIIAIGVVQIPVFARLLRGSMLAQRNQDYVLAARSLGLTRGSVTMSHVLPNSLGPVIVQATLVLATAVIEAAALSFLGLGGGRETEAEWGRMLTGAQAELSIAPQLAILPGLCISITALGFTLLGESLREALDPRMKRRR